MKTGRICELELIPPGVKTRNYGYMISEVSEWYCKSDGCLAALTRLALCKHKKWLFVVITWMNYGQTWGNTTGIYTCKELGRQNGRWHYFLCDVSFVSCICLPMTNSEHAAGRYPPLTWTVCFSLHVWTNLSISCWNRKKCVLLVLDWLTHCVNINTT